MVSEWNWMIIIANELTFWGHSEVFWVGVQALTAIAALIGLLAYVKYTADMKKAAELTLRATVTPVLSLVSKDFVKDEFGLYRLELQVRDDGNGAAFGLSAWHVHVEKRFSLPAFEGAYLAPNINATVERLGVSELLHGETTTIRFSFFSDRDARLYVVEAQDQTEGRHQLQLLANPNRTIHVQRMRELGPNVDRWPFNYFRRRRRQVV